MTIEVVSADYSNSQHARDIVAMMDDYAQDPMGGGQALSEYSRRHLVQGLAVFPGAVTLLAYVKGRPVGIASALPGYSSFAAKPLLNIHDLSVVQGFRGQGIAQLLLKAVEDVARARSCCKVTLEVLEGNKPAQKAYRAFGFTGYELDPLMGQAVFWEKKLS